MPRPCEVCCDLLAKYTCPQCTTKYCSVSCYKAHKETCVTKNSTSKEILEENIQDKEEGELSETELDNITDDKVDIATLEKLGDSEEMQQLLQNPHLRDMMKGLVKSEDASKLMETAMKEPIFTEFVDECLKIVEPEAT